MSAAKLLFRLKARDVEQLEQPVGEGGAYEPEDYVGDQRQNDGGGKGKLIQVDGDDDHQGKDRGCENCQCKK